jgi:hypothetical protein
VKILDTILGRTKPTKANLDALFGLPGAVITLQAAEALVPTGQGGVCFKPAAGQPFAQTAEEFEGLLGVTSGDASTTTVHHEKDSFGYEWIVLTTSDFETLVTQVHVVNSTLKDQGYESMLLCSVFGWRPAEVAGGTATVYLVYLYKRGAFYPFVPQPGKEQRDLETEMKLQIVLAEDLAIEPEKERWMPLWGLPVH